MSTLVDDGEKAYIQYAGKEEDTWTLPTSWYKDQYGGPGRPLIEMVHSSKGGRMLTLLQSGQEGTHFCYYTCIILSTK